MLEGVFSLAAVIGALFGVIAFVRSLDFTAKIVTLEHEIAGLRAALQRRAEPQPPQPQPAKSEAAAAAAASPLAPAPFPAPTPAAAPRDKAAPPPLWPQATPMEARLSGNWLIWIGGAALALGGAFLLKAAVDAGFFGPVMRIAAAVLAGLAMIAGGEWTRRLQVEESAAPGVSAAWRRSNAPPVLAGAGGATLYAAVYAAYAIYQMIPAFVALVMLTAASASLAALAMRHRAPPLAQMGLGGAYVAPLLTGGGADGAAALLFYVFAVSAAGFLLMQKMGWRAAGLIALAGGLCWPTIVITAGAAPIGVVVYLPAFLALAAAAAWRDASTAPEPDKILSGESSSPVILRMFHFALLSVVILAFLAGAQRAGNEIALPLWGSIAALTLFLASRRDGLSLAPIVALAGALLATALGGDRGAGDPGVSLALASLFGAGGGLAMQVRVCKAPLALVAAVGPVAFLAVQFWLNRSAADGSAVALAAIALTAANVGLLSFLRRQSGSFDAHPGAVSAFVVGAAFASCLAAVALFEGLFLSAAIALQTPVMALLWRRYRLSALKYLSTVMAVAASLRLLLLPEVADYAFGPTPVLNLLIAGYLAPAGAFWFAARLYERGGLARSARVVQALEGAAIALFAAFVTLEIRHLLNDGEIGARNLTLLEISLQIISWMSIAAFMRWRFGAGLTPVRRFAELALSALSLASAFYGPLTLFNPVWGARQALVAGPPIINMLLIYYLAPALVFTAASVAARRGGARIQSRISGGAAALMGLAWVMLSIRHAFHAPDLSWGGVGLAEGWCYSAAMTLYAAAILVAGAVRRSDFLRLGGFAFLALAMVKVFIIDLAGLDGLWRATAFLGLGGAIVGVAILYQRLNRAPA